MSQDELKTYFDIAMSLLTLLSMLWAFLGFFYALRFSKEWPTKVEQMFKVMNLILYIAVIITGINFLFFINGSLLQQIIFFGVRVSYLLSFVVISMLISATAIISLQIYPKLYSR